MGLEQPAPEKFKYVVIEQQDDFQAIYANATRALEEAQKMEETAAEDPLVTVVMPIRAAIEALSAIAVKLSLGEESIQDGFRQHRLADSYSRAEVAKLRVAMEAFRVGLKALDSEHETEGDAK